MDGRAQAGERQDSSSNAQQISIAQAQWVARSNAPRKSRARENCSVQRIRAVIGMKLITIVSLGAFGTRNE